jgi:Flp pilus assembly protein TadG
MVGTTRARIIGRVKRLWRSTAARRLIHQQDGAAAVEFGLVAAPFLALVFAILETSLVFFAGQALETAAADSARLIMTGQAQAQSLDQTKFKEAVCGKIYGLFDCNAGIYVDVKSYNSFANIPTSNPVSNGTLQTADFGYQPGAAGDIVVVRLMYQWPVYVSLLGLNLADLKGGKRLLISTVAFRNEPF